MSRRNPTQGSQFSGCWWWDLAETALWDSDFEDPCVLPEDVWQ